MMRNAFYFISKALLSLDIFTFFSCPIGRVERRLDKKAMVYFKIYQVTDWKTK